MADKTPQEIEAETIAKAKADELSRAKAQEQAERKTHTKMTKDGETLWIHPDTVGAHRAAGWKEA